MIHSAATGKIDKRTLNNAQRVAIGLAPRQSPVKRGPADSTEKQERELAELNRAILRGEINPASVRLAEQLREIFCKWGERGIGPRYQNSKPRES